MKKFMCQTEVPYW